MKAVQFTLFSCAVIFSMAAGDKRDKLTYSDNQYKVEYEMENGLYDGDYKSWYTNGNKRAEGVFLNNVRCGMWTVYDSTGRMRMQRNYKNNYEYETIFPALPKEGPAILFSAPIYKLEYNGHGFIQYFFLHERAVAISKRIWRYMPANSNPQFFSDQTFYRVLLDSIALGKIKVYKGGVYNEFENPLSDEDKKRMMDTTNYEILGFRILEDWFFDKDRMLSEQRPVGICPVVKFNSQQDSTNLGWIGFSWVRPILAAQKVSGTVPAYIRTLDDVIFFRYFRSRVYRESRLYDRANVELSWNQQFGFETNLIELEHDQWIFFTK